MFLHQSLPFLLSYPRRPPPKNALCLLSLVTDIVEYHLLWNKSTLSTVPSFCLTAEQNHNAFRHVSRSLGHSLRLLLAWPLALQNGCWSTMTIAQWLLLSFPPPREFCLSSGKSKGYVCKLEVVLPASPIRSCYALCLAWLGSFPCLL